MTKQPPRLSQSIMRTLLSRGPFHAWHEHPDLGGLKRKPTKEMGTGTLAHELILGGSKVVVHDFRDWKTNKAKEAKAETYAAGKTPILQKQVDAVQRAANAIRAALDAHGLSPELFTCEHRIEWEYGGVACIGTPDAYLVEEDSAVVWDLKTTKNLANPGKTARKAADSGWAMQREAYVTAIETLYPKVAGRVAWYWVLAEIEEPYQVVVVPAGASMVELGRMQWERAIVQWAELLSRGWEKPWDEDWSGGLEAPSYELNRELELLDELTGSEDE